MDDDLHVVVRCIKEYGLIEEIVVFSVRVPANWEEVSTQGETKRGMRQTMIWYGIYPFIQC